MDSSTIILASYRGACNSVSDWRARCAIDPAILLMDEPFSALDSQTRRGLQEDLLDLHAENRKTIVFVTHSVDEAVRLGDRIVLLSTRPAVVEEVVVVNLPRPRPRETSARCHVLSS